MIICLCLLTLVLRMCVTTSVFGLSADLSNKYSMIASLLNSLVEENDQFTMVSLYINTIASLLWQKYCRHILNTGNNIFFIMIFNVFIILMPSFFTLIHASRVKLSRMDLNMVICQPERWIQHSYWSPKDAYSKISKCYWKLWIFFMRIHSWWLVWSYFRYHS